MNGGSKFRCPLLDVLFKNVALFYDVLLRGDNWVGKMQRADSGKGRVGNCMVIVDWVLDRGWFGGYGFDAAEGAEERFSERGGECRAACSR